jgi:hypothetical protein
MEGEDGGHISHFLVGLGLWDENELQSSPGWSPINELQTSRSKHEFCVGLTLSHINTPQHEKRLTNESRSTTQPSQT